MFVPWKVWSCWCQLCAWASCLRRLFAWPRDCRAPTKAKRCRRQRTGAEGAASPWTRRSGRALGMEPAELWGCVVPLGRPRSPAALTASGAPALWIERWGSVTKIRIQINYFNKIVTHSIFLAALIRKCMENQKYFILAQNNFFFVIHFCLIAYREKMSWFLLKCQDFIIFDTVPNSERNIDAGYSQVHQAAPNFHVCYLD